MSSSSLIVAALGGLLFGYDTGVINGAIGPLKAHFSLDPQQEGWAMGCALLGCALGAAGAGAISDRFGRKKVLILSAILFFVSAIGTAMPHDARPCSSSFASSAAWASGRRP